MRPLLTGSSRGSTVPAGPVRYGLAQVVVPAICTTSSVSCSGILSFRRSAMVLNRPIFNEEEGDQRANVPRVWIPARRDYFGSMPRMRRTNPDVDDELDQILFCIERMQR